jgi:hypothetical protein
MIEGVGGVDHGVVLVRVRDLSYRVSLIKRHCHGNLSGGAIYRQMRRCSYGGSCMLPLLPASILNRRIVRREVRWRWRLNVLGSAA